MCFPYHSRPVREETRSTQNPPAAVVLSLYVVPLPGGNAVFPSCPLGSRLERQMSQRVAVCFISSLLKAAPSKFTFGETALGTLAGALKNLRAPRLSRALNALVPLDEALDTLPEAFNTLHIIRGFLMNSKSCHRDRTALGALTRAIHIVITLGTLRVSSRYSPQQLTEYLELSLRPQRPLGTHVDSSQYPGDSRIEYGELSPVVPRDLESFAKSIESSRRESSRGARP